MEVSIQKLPKSKVELKIKLPVEEFKRFLEKATFELGKDLEVEGFRKGRAPREVIEREIGFRKILAEAAQEAIKENYKKAILENKIEAISQPKIEVLKLAPGNPFEFKAEIQILPEVKLPDYKKIASQIKKREVSVSKEEIEKLKAEKERIERERVRQEILERIAKESETEIPEILIESEKRRILENLKAQVPYFLQISFEDYLKKINKTEQELLDSFLPEAEKRVKEFLVLGAIGKKESVKASDSEIEQQKNEILKKHPQAKNLDPEKLKDYTERVIENEKTFKFLEGYSQ